MNFNIDEQFLISCNTEDTYSKYRGKTDLSATELIEVLKGEDICRVLRSCDHPVFDSLRCHLEKYEYIKTERSSWNGDRVLKAFTINDLDFNPGDRFPCGGALGIHLIVEREYRKERNEINSNV